MTCTTANRNDEPCVCDTPFTCLADHLVVDEWPEMEVERYVAGVKRDDITTTADWLREVLSDG